MNENRGGPDRSHGQGVVDGRQPCGVRPRGEHEVGEGEGGYARELTAEEQASQQAVLVTVSDASFDQDVLQSDLPVLVDLWAPWCSPCRLIAPIVDKLAKEYAGRLKVAKLNVDNNPVVARKFNIRGIPTLVFFKDGDVVDTVVGALPKAALAGKVAALA